MTSIPALRLKRIPLEWSVSRSARSGILPDPEPEEGQSGTTSAPFVAAHT